MFHPHYLTMNDRYCIVFCSHLTEMKYSVATTVESFFQSTKKSRPSKKPATTHMLYIFSFAGSVVIVINVDTIRYIRPCILTRAPTERREKATKALCVYV